MREIEDVVAKEPSQLPELLVPDSKPRKRFGPERETEFEGLSAVTKGIAEDFFEWRDGLIAQTSFGKEWAERKDKAAGIILSDAEKRMIDEL